jgi:hypothetical protein
LVQTVDFADEAAHDGGCRNGVGALVFGRRGESILGTGTHHISAFFSVSHRGGLEHLKIETRLIDERFASVCVMDFIMTR